MAEESQKPSVTFENTDDVIWEDTDDVIWVDGEKISVHMFLRRKRRY